MLPPSVMSGLCGEAAGGERRPRWAVPGLDTAGRPVLSGHRLTLALLSGQFSLRGHSISASFLAREASKAGWGPSHHFQCYFFVS